MEVLRYLYTVHERTEKLNAYQITLLFGLDEKQNFWTSGSRNSDAANTHAN